MLGFENPNTLANYDHFILGVNFMLTIISYIGVLIGAVAAAAICYLAAVKVKFI